MRGVFREIVPHRPRNAADTVAGEGHRHTAVPLYTDHFRRMSVERVTAGVAAERLESGQRALRVWEGAIDQGVVRKVTAHGAVSEHPAPVRAAQRA